VYETDYYFLFSGTIATDKAIKPADEACTCRQQTRLSDWHAPTAVAEVSLALGQAHQQTLHCDEATHSLYVCTVTDTT